MLDDSTPADAISLRSIVEAVGRRKRPLIGIIVCSVAIGGFFSLRAPVIYRSTAQLLVTGKTQKPGSYAPGNPISDVVPTDNGRSVDTQIQVLQSQAIKDQTNQQARTPAGKVRVTASQIKDTDVIEVSAESGNATYAERFLTSLPLVYTRYVASTRMDDLERALAFSEQRLHEENGRLSQAQNDLDAFKKGAGISNLDKQRDGRISQAIALQSQIDTAMSDVVGLEAQLRAEEAARRALPAYVVTPVTTTNPNVAALTEKAANLETDRQRALVLFKQTDPRVQEMDAQLADLRRRLAAQPATITTNTRSPNPAIPTYNARVDELRSALVAKRAALDKLRASANPGGIEALTANESQLARLTRAVDLHRNSADMLATAVSDLSIRVKANVNQVHVITPAGQAALVSPRHAVNLTLAALAGIFLAICTMLLLEYFDDRVRSPKDAQHLLASPVLGHVPVLQGTTAPDAARLLLTEAAAGESYRMLSTNVQVAMAEGNLKSLLVTSAMPGEGKSMTAANLSAALASGSRSVILVDGDVSRPCLHRYFGVSRFPGLSDVLSGKASVTEALHPTDIPGLTLLPAGNPVSEPAGHPTASAIHTLYGALQGKADIVICDGPPLLCTADAQILAAQADGVVCVFAANTTRISALQEAASALSRTRSNVIGLVLNRADRSAIPYYDRDRFYGRPDDDWPIVLTPGRRVPTERGTRSGPDPRTRSDARTIEGDATLDDEGASSFRSKQVARLSVAILGVLAGAGLLWPMARVPAVTSAGTRTRQLATAEPTPYPDPKLTPGEIGKPGPPQPVPLAIQRSVLKAYRVPERSSYSVVCRLIPAELGGTNNPRNLWPLTPWFAELKYRLDRAVIRSVQAGRLKAPEARRELSRDWIKMSHRYDVRNHGKPNGRPAARR